MSQLQSSVTAILPPQNPRVRGVPDGFEPVAGTKGFMRFCGEFYLHAQRPVLGVRIADEHLNAIGIVHGGFMAMLADSAFGVVMVRRFGTLQPRTLHLSVDYLGPVHAGDWVEAHVDMLKQGRRVANVNCRIMVGDRTALHAAGVFYLGNSDGRPSHTASVSPLEGHAPA